MRTKLYKRLLPVLTVYVLSLAFILIGCFAGSPKKAQAITLTDNRIVMVASGYGHTLVLFEDNRVFAFGYNGLGQLGDGTSGSDNNRATPVDVTDNFPSDVTITQVAVKNYQSFALSEDGRLFSFGYNNYGQLGDGTTISKSTPVEITGNFPSDATIKQIEAGYQHSFAMSSDGRVFAFGYNELGQLGDGTTVSKPTPTEITDNFPDNVTITQISAGQYHTLALSSDCRVFAFGGNNYGQLGDDGTENENQPLEITDKFPNDVTITQIVAGYTHSLAVSSDGRLFAFGSNHYGQLGDGTTVDKNIPTEITGNFPAGIKITQVAAGDIHSIALLEDNRIFTFGRNEYAQLGDRNIVSSRSVPAEAETAIDQGDKILQITAGQHAGFALTISGRLYACGYNDYGQFGGGSTSGRITPGEITGNFPEGAGGTQIAAGDVHSFAVLGDGRIFSFGNNLQGQLGDGTDVTKDIPAEITGNFPDGTTVKQISAGRNHSLALSEDGKIFAWGANAYGQLGKSGLDKKIPMELTDVFPNGVTITNTATGRYHNLALSSDNRIFAWGYNANGQLGDGTTINKSAPTEITDRFPNGLSITQIASEGNFSLALSSNGRLFSWGFNASGQLGDGSTANQTAPVEITGNFPVGVTITQIAAGFNHCLAASSDNRIFAWGYNAYGQLGDGTTINKPTPTEITGNFQESIAVTQMVAGEYHSLILSSAGRIFAFGRNDFGQLGDGTNENSITPIDITNEFPNDFSATQIAAGQYHNIVLGADGRVFTFANNDYGQLGNGGLYKTFTLTITPTDAQTPSITAQPQSATVSEGGNVTLSVTATVTDGGTLSYQWYKNTAAGNTGGTAVTGAAGASYSPDTSVIGTAHYYVVITNTNVASGKTAAVTSNAVVVTVNEADNGLPPGAIIGIVIGAIVLSGGGFAAYWFIIRKKKSADKGK